MFTSLILVIIILAAFSLIWWGINSLTLPQPVKVVILVAIGLIMLAIIYNAVASGGFHLGTLR